MGVPSTVGAPHCLLLRIEHLVLLCDHPVHSVHPPKLQITSNFWSGSAFANMGQLVSLLELKTGPYCDALV